MSEDEHVKRGRGPLHADVKGSLREVGIQLSLLNHRVSGRLGLRSVDLDCLNIIHRDGPIGPSALARRTGLHPATVTGILDRLERDGWVERRRDPSDRRAVQVQALRDRNRELFDLLAGMNAGMEDILAQYDHDQLELLAEFLRRTTAAGQDATDALAEEA